MKNYLASLTIGIVTLSLLSFHALAQSVSGANILNLSLTQSVSSTPPVPIATTKAPQVPFSTSNVVGTSNATAEVSSTGAATYELAIAVPTGTAGLQPNLSISYNSQGGNGLLGNGWSLGGLSMINLAPKNFHYNFSETNFPNQDYGLELDGQRLILVSGTYGENGSEYRTEIDTYKKIVLEASGALNGFKVYAKNGYLYEYGGTVNSQVNSGRVDFNFKTAFSWRLRKVTDANGNYITYTYQQANGEVWIDKIDYTANDGAGLLPFASVKFTYITRQDNNEYYTNIYKISRTKLLSAIQVNTKNKQFRKYDFAYNFNGYHSELAEIKETGSDNSSYNTTKINWGPLTNPSTIASPTNVILNGSPFTKPSKQILSGDFNGDGKSELLAYNEGERNGYNFSGYWPNTNWILYTYNETTKSSVNTASGTFFTAPSNFYSNNLLAQDLDKDGKDELIQVYMNMNTTTHDVKVKVYSFNGTNFVDATNLFPEFYRDFTATNELRRIYNYEAKIGDFDGDNTNDLMLLQSYFEPQGIVYYKIIDIDNTPMLTSSLNYQNTGVNLGNSNGNLKTDIYISYLGEIKVFEFNRPTLTQVYEFSGFKYIIGQSGLNSYDVYKSKIFVNDVNNDGLTDIVAIKEGEVYFSLTKNSNNNYFLRLDVAGGGSASFVGDFIGDEGVELLFTTPTQESYLYSITESGLILLKYQPSEVNLVSGNFKIDYLSVLDYNSDGKLDLMIPEEGVQYHVAYFTAEPNTFGLVTSIENGLGNTVYFTYGSINKSTSYSRTITGVAPVFAISIPFNVVTALQQNFGTAYTLNTTYSYKNLLNNINGLGILGFEQVTKINQTNAKTEVYNYSYPPNYAYNQWLSSMIYKDNGGTLISEKIFTNTLTTTAKVIRPLTQLEINKDYIYTTSSSSSTTFDAYGNISIQEDKIFNDLSTTTLAYTQKSTNTYATFGTWCPASLTQTNLSKQFLSSGEGAQIYVTKYFYDSKGNLDQKIDNFNLSKPLTTTYSNRVLGQPQNILINVIDAEDKSSILKYDLTGRFIIENTNTKGQISKSSYDDFGRLVSATGIDAITVTYEYDGFGRQIKTVTPTGTTTTTYSWTQGSPTGSLYKIHTSAPNKPYATQFYDAAGRIIRVSTAGRNNTVVNADKVYNANGTLLKESKPYYGAETPIWTEYTYDNLLFRVTQQKVNAVISNYSYNGRTVTYTDPKGRTTVTLRNALGNTVSVTDAKNNITSFSYNNLLQPKTMGTNVITYDIFGNKTSITDPNAGTTIYTYDSYSRLISETDAKGNTYTFTYDALDRPITRSGPDENIVYTYKAAGNGIGQISSIAKGTNMQLFDYSPLGQLTKLTEQTEGQTFITQYNYETGTGNLIDQIFPSGFKVLNEYDNNGFLKTVKRADNLLPIWTQGIISSTQSQYKLGNTTKNVSFKFDATYNNLTSISVDGNFNWQYSFEKETGNLLSRRDGKRFLLEEFKYDDLDRLEEIYQNGTLNNKMVYANNGNITSKTDAGQYTYDNTRIHALVSVTPPTAFPSASQNITFNGFKRATEISENVNGNQNVYNIVYGTNRERIKSTLKTNGQLVFTKYYANGFEREIKGAVTKDVHYITALGGVVATYVTVNNVGTMYYPLTDHLGSILQLRKDDGTVAEEMSYDAWGRRRNPDTWSTATVTQPVILSRGYTGHEHLDIFNLINMNARLYDPQAGRMLSVDNEVTDVNNFQNYNKYSYALNNPLKYIDPTGNTPIMSPGGYGGNGYGGQGGNPGNTGGGNVQAGKPSGNKNPSDESGQVNDANNDDKPLVLNNTGKLNAHNGWDVTSDILGISEDNPTFTKAPFGEVVSSTFGDSYMTCTYVSVWNNNTNQYDFASGECVTADAVVTNKGGGTGDPTYNNVNTGLGAFGIGWSTKEIMIQGAVADARRISMAKVNNISNVRTLGATGARYMKVVKGASTGANLLGAGMTLADGYVNGFQAHHAADLGIQAAIYGIGASIPVAGWIIGSGYFLGDMYFQSTHNGMSITQYYLDGKR